MNPPKQGKILGGIVSINALEYLDSFPVYNWLVLHRSPSGGWDVKTAAGTSLTVDFTLAMQKRALTPGVERRVRHVVIEGGQVAFDEALELVTRAASNELSEASKERPLELWLHTGLEAEKPKKDKGPRAATMLASLSEEISACAKGRVRVLTRDEQDTPAVRDDFAGTSNSGASKALEARVRAFQNCQAPDKTITSENARRVYTAFWETAQCAQAFLKQCGIAQAKLWKDAKPGKGCTDANFHRPTYEDAGCDFALAKLSADLKSGAAK